MGDKQDGNNERGDEWNDFWARKREQEQQEAEMHRQQQLQAEQARLQEEQEARQREREMEAERLRQEEEEEAARLKEQAEAEALERQQELERQKEEAERLRQEQAEQEALATFQAESEHMQQFRIWDELQKEHLKNELISGTTHSLDLDAGVYTDRSDSTRILAAADVHWSNVEERITPESRVSMPNQTESYVQPDLDFDTITELDSEIIPHPNHDHMQELHSVMSQTTTGQLPYQQQQQQTGNQDRLQELERVFQNSSAGQERGTQMGSQSMYGSRSQGHPQVRK